MSNNWLKSLSAKEKLVLLLIKDREVYPRDLNNQLRDFTKGREGISKTYIYILLRKLRLNGYVINEWRESTVRKNLSRHCYHLSEKGESVVQQLMKEPLNFYIQEY